MPLLVGELGAAAWPEAMRLAARAMQDYRYVHALYGPDPADRLAGTAAEYVGRAWDPRRTAVGAWAGSLLVGFARGWERCPVCEEPEPLPAGADPVSRATREYEEARRVAHGALPPHGHVAPVMVEPLLGRRGVGGFVVTALLQRLDAATGTALALECVPDLVPFYGRFGFAVAADLLDPLEPGMVAMLRPAPTQGGRP